jgi:GT2 family glycosyltransferase
VTYRQLDALRRESLRRITSTPAPSPRAEWGGKAGKLNGIMTNPKVCISILNWNGAEKTIACLETVRALDYDNYTVIVVDNASRDESVARIRAAFPDVEVLQAETNLGYAGGHRLALEHVMDRGVDLFWVLNNDTTVRPDALSALVAAYQRWGDAIYGSVTLRADDELRVQFGGGWEVDAAGKPIFALYNATRGMAYERYLAVQQAGSLKGNVSFVAQ